MDTDLGDWGSMWASDDLPIDVGNHQDSVCMHVIMGGEWFSMEIDSRTDAQTKKMHFQTQSGNVWGLGNPGLKMPGRHNRSLKMNHRSARITSD